MKLSDKVNEMIRLGKNMQTTMPEMQHLNFVIDEKEMDDLQEVAHRYKTIVLAPCISQPYYRTTVLDGCVKVEVRSPRLSVKTIM
jgi:hypothetical protein